MIGSGIGLPEQHSCLLLSFRPVNLLRFFSKELLTRIAHPGFLDGERAPNSSGMECFQPLRE